MNKKKNRASNALRIFSEAGTLPRHNARLLSLVSKNARQSALNMVNAITINCSKAGCLEKLNKQIATFGRVKVIHILSNDAQNQTFLSALAILKNSKMNLQELRITQTCFANEVRMPNMLLPQGLGDLCKKIRKFSLTVQDKDYYTGRLADLKLDFTQAFVNLDTLELSGPKLDGNAILLPKLSNVILSYCEGYSAFLSANRSNIKRLVLVEYNDNSKFLDVRYDNLEFLQLEKCMPRKPLHMTTILKQCPNLKTLITTRERMIVSNVDVIDKVTFLALHTDIYRENDDPHRYTPVDDYGDVQVSVSEGIVKMKGFQYMIKAFANKEELEKTKKKLHMHVPLAQDDVLPDAQAITSDTNGLYGGLYGHTEAVARMKNLPSLLRQRGMIPNNVWQ